MPALPTPTFECYKPEIDAVERSGKSVVRKPVTSIPNNPNPKYLAPPNTNSLYDIFEMPMSEVGCYDKKSGKPKGLSEFMFIGLGMTLGSFNNNVDTIGSTLIVDLRRVICPERVDWSFGVTPGAPNFSIKTNPEMKVKDAMSIFRKQIDDLHNDNGFIKELIAQFKPQKMFTDIQGCLSNAGPMKFKSPIKDFYLKSTDYGFGADPIFSIFSYSKIGNGKNQLVCSIKTAPAVITSKMQSILSGSYKYWLKHISSEAKIKDAFDEMKAVQKLISNDF